MALAPHRVHAVDRALSVAAALGLPDGEPADFGGDRLLAAAAPAAAERPYAFLHPGAGWGNKVYPPERWGEVAARLAAQGGVETRVSVAPGEEALARRVVDAAGGAAREASAGDLASLVSQLRGARLALGGDTGPLHLAHALGVPSLLSTAPPTRAATAPTALPSRRCGRHCRAVFAISDSTRRRHCLRVVPAARVAARALALLGEAGNEAMRLAP